MSVKKAYPRSESTIPHNIPPTILRHMNTPRATGTPPLSEFEQFLEQRGAELFVNPFAIVSVLGRRCMVFRGGKASIVSLETRPTTLLEVIARSGGLNQYDRADKIQVIRGDLKDPLLYEINLSEISGLKDGGLIVQSNDIIYIRSRPRVLARASNEISTVTSLLLSSSSLLTTILLLRQQ